MRGGQHRKNKTIYRKTERISEEEKMQNAVWKEWTDRGARGESNRRRREKQAKERNARETLRGSGAQRSRGREGQSKG